MAGHMNPKLPLQKRVRKNEISGRDRLDIEAPMSKSKRRIRR